MAKVNYPEEVKALIFNTVCDRLSKGETLNAICTGKPIIPPHKNPDRHTITNWSLKNKEWGDQLHAAGLALLDYWRDQMIDIADDESRDQVPDGKGGFKSDNTSVNRDRLKVDTRKWIMCKLNPGKYGDKVEVGGNKDQPLTVNVKIV